MNLSVALVCFIAALPPIVYWVRFFLGVQKRTAEKEAEEQARQVRNSIRWRMEGKGEWFTQERIEKLTGRRK